MRKVGASEWLWWAVTGVLAAGLVVAAAPGGRGLEIVGPAELFPAPWASTPHAEIRLTVSPDGRTALWFARDRPGGAGGYDIWIARRSANGWEEAMPVAFNSPGRDFDPAFSADGRFVYFCSDRSGGRGGDDVWRAPVTGDGFGTPENLGPAVNSAAAEFAPMLSGDGRTLLFSSDRPGGAGGHDLFTARWTGARFLPARRLGGGINTAAHEFDATFVADGETVVFARTSDFSKARVDLFAARRDGGFYEPGRRLPDGVNDAVGNTYGAMIDWSQPDRLLFSARRDQGRGMDLHQVRYRLSGAATSLR